MNKSSKLNLLVTIIYLIVVLLPVLVIWPVDNIVKSEVNTNNRSRKEKYHKVSSQVCFQCLKALSYVKLSSYLTLTLGEEPEGATCPQDGRACLGWRALLVDSMKERNESAKDVHACLGG